MENKIILPLTECSRSFSSQNQFEKSSSQASCSLPSTSVHVPLALFVSDFTVFCSLANGTLLIFFLLHGFHDFHWLMAYLLFSFLCLSHSFPPVVYDSLHVPHLSSTTKENLIEFYWIVFLKIECTY